MPQTIDDVAFKTRTTFDVSAPQGTATGIPVKQIPHLEYPRVVYKHPKEPFITILHRNHKQEVVNEEVIQAEHLSKVVADKKEFDAALKDGFSDKPYLPKALPDRNASLYGKGE